ncbi:poly-gamma-glutamate synthesis protein / capsule biosynthesis protein capA [Cystobacter fuscus DSM 2262]|uniref:Poly-gamma-glutamate synthesis protein / capsule biosynthesis protein capA n=1 Tax=Cystobacter fuscus (strain ATCC 25194 / DSM 2262 / NBRC 100088 / M29) TaxID=1242864 RepID=S9PIR1_CYSF2|nr:CapA family protein [Cystobacter fuscus]EPX62297.1 poly-gamma-glutamate synthesis protein / capsule biosynthesis protein capA [Cystobacter fuscus DSM 2262]
MPAPAHGEALTLFLCGDVMTGRGIDQVLPHPCPPHLYESYVRDARDYVALAEEVNGPIPRPVGLDYIWGDALTELERRAPDVRLINLETSITTSEEWWPDKGIHYRMSPAHAACLTAARIGCCALANNHVLDWGYEGLRETLATLSRVGIATAGAGTHLEQARAPALLDVPGKGRVAVFSFGTRSSGIPPEWAASTDRPGVELLENLAPATARGIGARVRAIKHTGALVIASIHWGGNWGYEVPSAQREFARALIDEAGVDVVHGHSSHHPRGIEIHRERPILYGCGDFLNDYEGIRDNEGFRGDLTLMYFVTLEPTSGRLLSFRMTPMRVRRFQVCRASSADAGWLQGILDREGRQFGTRVTLEGDGSLWLHWT